MKYFVSGVSVMNSLGRLGWSSVSDFTGTKAMYGFFGVTAPICFVIPLLTTMAAEDPTGSVHLMYGFSGMMLLATSIYGGTYSVLPAYLTSIFGPQHVGAIHGRGNDGDS